MSKVVLITGASSGMGKASSLLLAENGYTVYAGIRSSADELRLEANERGVHIETVVLDVQDSASVKNAVAEIVRKEGRIDVLVNNAGFGLLATVEDGTDDEMIQQFDVNVFGLLRATREVLPYMRKEKSGVIINISSFLGKMGLPLLAHYNASKYAVEGITDSLRYEALPFNIRVHAIQSGLFGTNFVKKGLVANARTTAEDSPYAGLVSHMVPIVAKAINEGPSPQPIAEAIKSIIENEDSPIAMAVGTEAETFIPMQKELSKEDFELKVKEIFGL